MKSEKEIVGVLDKVIGSKAKFYGMTYEEGVREALEWVLEEIPDREFVVNFE